MTVADTRGFLALLHHTFWERKVENEEYSDLFEFTNANIIIPLWESAYAEDRKVLLDATTFSLVKTYAETDLQIVKTAQPPDFIGYEIDYAIHLYNKKSYDMFNFFCREHLNIVCEAVFTRILQVARTPYYQELASFVLENLSRFLSSVKEGEPLDLPLHFEPLGPEEKASLLEEVVVPTSGRNNCGGKCVIKAHRKGGCLVSLESDVYDESQECLVACVRGRGYRKTFLSSERLRYPMVRVGKRGEGRFRRISWDEAIGLMKEKLETITERYGVGSRFVMYGCGDTGITDGRGLMKRLLSRTGGFLDYHNSYSSACQYNALPYTYGTTECCSTFTTYYDSRLLILWANNPLVTEHTGEIIKVLKYHKEKKTPIVVIDPHFNETAAAYATMWLPIRPGTDCALASAVAYVLWEENLVDEAFLEKYCIGYDGDHMPTGFGKAESYKDYIYGTYDGVRKTPEWAEKITGLDRKKILAFARLYGQTKPAALLPGLGNNRVSNGEQNVRAMTILQCLTGNVGLRGGSSGGRGDKRGHRSIHLSRVSNPYGRSIPCFLWTDGITRGKEMTGKDGVRGKDSLDSSIRILFNIAGNTLINQHGDINRTAGILKDESLCEFIVVSDLFMTPSARFADLLLPGASLFESTFITRPWHDGNFLLGGNKVLEPLFEGKEEFEWITELARRMGVEDFVEGDGTSVSLQKTTYERFRREWEPELPTYEVFMREGGYRYRNNPEFIAFQEEREDFEHHPFPTPSGKIEFFSPRLLSFEDPVLVPPVPKYVETFESIGDEKYRKYPLQLIGWHTKRRCHSIHDNNSWMEDLEPNRVYLNPKNAEERGLAEGDLAKVFNDRGVVEIEVTVTSRLMEGVVCIPEGAWYTPDERGVDIRGSVNTLSTLEPTPVAKGNAQHSCLCEIEKVER